MNFHSVRSIQVMDSPLFHQTWSNYLMDSLVNKLLSMKHHSTVFEDTRWSILQTVSQSCLLLLCKAQLYTTRFSCGCNWMQISICIVGLIKQIWPESSADLRFQRQIMIPSKQISESSPISSAIKVHQNPSSCHSKSINIHEKIHENFTKVHPNNHQHHPSQTKKKHRIHWEIHLILQALQAFRLSTATKHLTNLGRMWPTSRGKFIIPNDTFWAVSKSRSTRKWTYHRNQSKSYIKWIIMDYNWL